MNRIATRRRALAALALLPLGARAAEPVLPRLTDLRRAAADVRRDRRPLLLFFSTPGCPYCIEVRRSYLAPRLTEAPQVTIREVDITSSRRLTGDNGEPITESRLAARFGVRAVPVVLLVDDAFKPLGAPLVGLSADFYESLLASAIDAAVAALARR